MLMTKILMCVFGNVKNDGRVLRSIQALNLNNGSVSLVSFDVTLFIKNIVKHFSYYPKPNRAINLLMYSFFILRCIKRTNPEIIYLHDYYLCNAVFWIKLFYPKVKVIYDAHELIIPNGGVYNGKRQKFFYKIEKSLIKKMDLVIVANNERGYLMREHYNLEKTPLTIKNIPDIKREADSKIELTSETESFISNAKAKGKKIFVYQGAMVTGRELERVVNIFSLIASKTALIMIGNGANLPSLKKHGEIEGNNESISFTGHLDVDQMYCILGKSDFGIITYSSANLNNIFCAPNKLYEYANLMLPFITTNQKTIVNEVSGYSFAHIIDMEVEDAKIAEEILVFSSSYSFNRDEFSKFNRLNNWGLEQEKFEKIVTEL